MVQYWLAKRVLLEPLLSRKNFARQTLALWLSAGCALCGSGAVQPSTTSRKSPPPSRVQQLLTQGHQLSSQGRLHDACQLADQAATLAAKGSDTRLQVKALLFVSGCRIRIFDYRAAREAAEKCRAIGMQHNDPDAQASAGVNLATIYMELGDYRLAEQEASRAAALFAQSPKSNSERHVKALLIYADTEAERTRNQIEAERAAGDFAAEQRDLRQLEQAYQRGIDVAHAAHLPQLEANLLEELGYSLLLAHHPERASAPLANARRLELAINDRDALATNEEHQAELELQNGDYAHALDLIDRAFASSSLSFHTTPQFYPLHIRGVLLEKLNRPDQALAELRKAVNAADQWRQGAPPGDATRTQMVVVLHDVYHDFAQLAAALSLERHDPALAREGLAVMARNRASNLREEITAALSRKQALPARYFDLLHELQAAQARVSLGENRPEDNRRLEQIRLQIRDLENQFGIAAESNAEYSEKISPQNSLKEVQGHLSSDQVLLSFSLGRERSFVWTVTGDSVSVYRLPGEPEIASVARRFSQDVQLGHDPKAAGLKLSREIFGVLPDEVWRRCDWVIAAEGVLLEGVPFSALVDLSSGFKVRFLSESHSIRLIPSELFLLSADKIGARQLFVGIGDPIYNTADSRRTAGGPASAAPGRAAVSLARLPGSEREIRTAARESEMPESRLLSGPNANLASLRTALAENPGIIHFAVHVVAPEGPFSQAALALSLTSDNMPELLTPEAIASFRVPGSLVILSGCSSETGEVLPGAGLMGLSRAWLLAGASAVVVSSWPTPDDSGRFFASFYDHLARQSGSIGQRAARALEAAQRDMQNQHDYRHSPSFWAAYSLISKE
jgi:CHAT domain-containing protein